jgi:hypothetical protein
MTPCSQPQMPWHFGKVRSVAFDEWPEADRIASTTARRPAELQPRQQLKRHSKLRRAGQSSSVNFLYFFMTCWRLDSTSEVCHFDFAGRYGDRGKGFIECHHTKPLSDIRPTLTILRLFVLTATA